MKVAIQGHAASFHSIAANRIFGDSIELVFCGTFREVFETLSDGNVDTAVVATENSLYGSINEVYDLLLKHDLFVVGETYEEIGLHLLGLPEAQLSDITDIYSQAPALGEASVFLDENLPNAERHEHADTALAAKEVKEWGVATNAAIASQAAAKTYGLEILANNIETHPHNYTRFIALSLKPNAAKDADKTSLVFRTADKPGALYNVLGIFAKYSINLTKLESRPIVGSAWNYMYYVDIETAVASDTGQKVMQELPSMATDIRVLGSYKSGLVAST